MSAAHSPAMDVPMKWLVPPAVLTASVPTRGFWLTVLPQLFRGAGVIARPPKEVGRSMGLSEEETSRSLTELSGLLENSEGSLVCPGLQREISIREKRRAAGRLGGHPLLRAGVPSPQGTVGAPVVPAAEQASAAAAPSSSSAEPGDVAQELDLFAAQPEISNGAEAAFENFWAAYPSKVGKGIARKAFMRAHCYKFIDRVLAAIERQRHGEKWRKGYIPNPSTWLNQERWSDEPSTPLARVQFELAGFPPQFFDWLQSKPEWAHRRWPNYKSVEGPIKEAFERFRTGVECEGGRPASKN